MLCATGIPKLLKQKQSIICYMAKHLLPTQFASTFRFIFTAPDLQKVDTVFNKFPFPRCIT